MSFIENPKHLSCIYRTIITNADKDHSPLNLALQEANFDIVLDTEKFVNLLPFEVNVKEFKTNFPGLVFYF